MLVDDGVKCQTVSPGRGEVPDVDIVVASGLHLTPEQQCVLGSLRTNLLIFDFNDVSDLEPQDDGPDQTERQSGMTIDDVMRSEVLQMNPLVVQEGQGLVHVFQAVNTHFALGRLRLQMEEN